MEAILILIPTVLIGVFVMLFTVKTFRMRALATLAVSFSGWCIFGFIGGLRNIGSWSGGPEVDLANYAALGGFIFLALQQNLWVNFGSGRSPSW